MNKIREFFNILFSLFRQYWKYKYRDIFMGFATLLITSGVAIILSGGAWKLLLAFDFIDLPADITFDANDLSGFGIFLVILGLSIGLLRLFDLGKQLTGVLIIHRGMEGMDTDSIKNTLPKSFLKGKLEVIDLHEGHQLHEGKVLHPERALDVINGLNQQIKSRLNGRDINDARLCFAGLAPIPLLVAAGYKISSRQECLILDYSRTRSWHGLDNLDDMEDILITEPTGAIKDNVAIVMPFSVEIGKTQLPNEIQDCSYIMNLRNGARPDSLDSSDKQVRIATEFYKLCSNMKAKHPNVKLIHIFLASQASFAFRLGSIISTSVIPAMSIYQYISDDGAYEWGVTISAGNKPFISNTNDI